MVISRDTSELGYSALRPNQELALGTFCEEATCLYRFQQVRARVHATVCYPGPSIFSGTDRVKRIYSLKVSMPWTT